MNNNSDAALDRLLRHMAWANSRVLSDLDQLPPEILDLHAPSDPDWPVGSIARHLVEAAGFYCRRLGAAVPAFTFDDDSSLSDLAQLAVACQGFDVHLRQLASEPESMTTYSRDGGLVVKRARSTIIAQAIHHATEHRTQIAGVLSNHGIREIDLDTLDLWSFGDSEGLGE